MNKVNMGANYTHRITLRVNEEQYNFLIKVSELLGVSPSDYLRMVVNSGMVSMQSQQPSVFGSENTMKGEVGTHENVKTDINNIV